MQKDQKELPWWKQRKGQGTAESCSLSFPLPKHAQRITGFEEHNPKTITAEDAHNLPVHL